jgi:hypothetical protein
VATPAVELIELAKLQLGEVGVGVFWSESEIQRWLNLGQRTMCIWKPGSYVHTAWVPLVKGPRQTVPSAPVTCLGVFDVTRNDPEHGGALSLVERKDLPPSWTSAVVVDGIGVEHWMYLPADPKTFWIYPAYDEPTDNKLELICPAVAPDVDVYLADNSLAPAPACASVSVDDTDALLNYVLGRACLKQTDHGVRERAAFFLQQYLVALGKGREAAMMANPQRILNVQGEQV